MLVLFDHGMPRPLRACLKGHIVKEAKQQGWETLKNGDLLKLAEEAGFDLLVTTDKNMRYQQNLSKRTIAIMVLSEQQWPIVQLHVSKIIVAVNAAKPGSYVEVDIPGK